MRARDTGPASFPVQLVGRQFKERGRRFVFVFVCARSCFFPIRAAQDIASDCRMA